MHQHWECLSLPSTPEIIAGRLSRAPNPITCSNSVPLFPLEPSRDSFHLLYDGAILSVNCSTTFLLSFLIYIVFVIPRSAVQPAPSAPPRPARPAGAPRPAVVRRPCPPAPPGWRGWSSPAKTASAASRCPDHVVRRALGRAAGLVAGQRPPAGAVDVQGFVHQPRRQRLHQPGQEGAGRFGLVAVGEEHQLVAPGAAGPGPRSSARQARPPRSRRRRSIRATSAMVRPRTKTVHQRLDRGWKPSWNGIRPSRSGAPRARSRTRSSAGSDRPSEAAPHPSGPTQPAAHRTTARPIGRTPRTAKAPRKGLMPAGCGSRPAVVPLPSEICGQRDTGLRKPVDKPCAAAPVPLHPLRYRGSESWLSPRTTFPGWDPPPADLRSCPRCRPPSSGATVTARTVEPRPVPQARPARSGRP